MWGLRKTSLQRRSFCVSCFSMASSPTTSSLVLVLTLAAASCQAFWPVNRAPQRFTTLSRASQNRAEIEDALYFKDQKLDHYSPEDSRVFKQKYFENLTFFNQPDGPIFLYLCGESTCFDGSFLRNLGSYAKMFGAAIVSLEHRYYGNSSPFQNFSVENMKYLSSKQALSDAAVFLNYYQDSINQRFKTQGLNRWVVVGGSYAGALSAWFRLKFPHLVVGSWASSGVVEAVTSYIDYDKQVGVSVGPECKQTLQQITRLVEKGLAENATAIKALFQSEKLNDLDFLSYVADMAAVSVRTGIQKEFCLRLQAANTNATGLLKTYANITMEYIGSSESYDADVLKAAVEANQTYARNAYSWHWQSCTEFGFFQVAPPTDSIRSTRLNLEYMLDYCSKLFGNGTRPDADATNLYYGGWNISGSRIMFLNGSQDPWRHASKQASSDADEPTFELICDTCAHGQDLWAYCRPGDTAKCEEIEKASQFIIQNFKSWLN